MANLTNSSNIIDEINSKLTNPEGGSNGQVLTMTGGIEAWWPAPAGYHIPSDKEWQAVVNMGVSLGAWASNGGDDFRIKMKLPFAGERSWFRSSDVDLQGSQGRYWSSTTYTDKNSYLLIFYSNAISPRNNHDRADGHSLRCFKDSPLNPSSSWTTIYAGSNGAGIFHNASEGVISISSDGQTWITIADKNLGATQVYNDGDTLSEANCGKYYQWGNNYGFPRTGTVATSSIAIDASAYGKGNPYSSDTFITVTPWDSSDNRSLWGMEDLGELKPEWKDIEALPEGGTAGQVLTKTDDGAEWKDAGSLNNEVLHGTVSTEVIADVKIYTFTLTEESIALAKSIIENPDKYESILLIDDNDSGQIPPNLNLDILRTTEGYFTAGFSRIMPKEIMADPSADVTAIEMFNYYYGESSMIGVEKQGYIGDVKYSDFNFVQLSGSSVELSISSAIEPTSNFTIKAPAELKEGIVYTLRVKNGNTAYTMTLGEGITNPGDTDVTLTPNAIDQFVFLAVDGVLELQPEAGGGGGSVTPEEFNDLKDKVDELELAKDPNVTVIGTPTILQGNISNFDTNSYLIAPFLSSFSNNPFVLHMDIATGTDVTTQQNIVDSVYGLAVAIKDGKFLIALSTNGTSWNIGQFEGAYTVLPNTDYHVEVEWTGSDFTLKYSTDGTSYTTDIATTLTTALSGKPLYFGGFGATSHPFKGTFNFNEWYFLSNGNKVWMGMDSVGLETRANVSLSNLDEEGEKKLLPSGGTEGQVLTKTATGTGWEDPSGGNNTVYVTQEEYDALTPKENVDYVIYGDGTEDGYVTESMLETALSGKVSSSSVSVIVDAGSSLPTNPDSKTLYLITS